MTKKEVFCERLKEFEFEFLQRDRHPILMADFWCRAAERFFEEMGLESEVVDYIYTYKNEGFVNIKQKNKLINHLAKDPIKNTLLIIDKTKDAIASFQRFLDILPQLNSLSDEQIILLWRKFDKVQLQVIPYFFLPYYLSEKNMVSNKIQLPKEVEEITDKHNALGILTFPKEKLAFQREQESLYHILKGKKSVKKHLEEFSWMSTFILLPKEPTTKKELSLKLQELQKSNFINEFELLENQRKKNELLRKKLELVLDERQLFLVRLSRELGQLLSWSIDEALRIYCELQVLFKEVAKRANIDFSNWAKYTSKELISLIRKKLVKKHSEKFIFISISGQRTILEDAHAIKLIKKLEPEKIEIKELHGQVAYEGFVTGKAKLCLTPTQSKELLEGEILITAMTTPEYVPAMKRSTAIITDEGGLLCHAAIIAREFQKPCIIGTKYATKIFQNGDVLEVNAKKGIVRKLSKSQHT